MNPTLVKPVTAGGTVGERRILKPHASNVGQFIEATAAADALVGTCMQPGGATAGQPMDMGMGGILEVICGGTIAAGAPVTSNGSAAAIAAAPATGANVRCLGFAYEAGVSGDIIRVLYAPHTLQGA